MSLPLVVERSTVGRIAERIVANELDGRGFRVTDLNKDGLSANADLLAAGHNNVWQVQVKGATNKPSEPWWIQYGHCTVDIIRNKGVVPMFNRRKSFYCADVVVLVAIRTLTQYRCIVLRAGDAEHAAQCNLDRQYRTLTRQGAEKKPHKVWLPLEPTPREHQIPVELKKSMQTEREILKNGESNWELLLTPRSTT
jgi:hypothetical protein